MKTFEMSAKALEAEDGEYILGHEDTGSNSCYMIYGALRPREKQRLVKPGEGHEEIGLAVKGDLEVTGYRTGTLREGSAFHITGDNECYLDNTSDRAAIYIIAGGHADGGHN